MCIPSLKGEESSRLKGFFAPVGTDRLRDRRDIHPSLRRNPVLSIKGRLVRSDHIALPIPLIQQEASRFFLATIALPRASVAKTCELEQRW